MHFSMITGVWRTKIFVQSTVTLHSSQFTHTIKSSSLIRSEFLLTNLNELATTGTSSFASNEHFSANFVLEFPILLKVATTEKKQRKSRYVIDSLTRYDAMMHCKCLRPAHEIHLQNNEISNAWFSISITIWKYIYTIQYIVVLLITIIIEWYSTYLPIIFVREFDIIFNSSGHLNSFGKFSLFFYFYIFVFFFSIIFFIGKKNRAPHARSIWLPLPCKSFLFLTTL